MRRHLDRMERMEWPGRIGIVILALCAVTIGSPFVLRELGPTIWLRYTDSGRPRTVRVWFVEREGAYWIRCGDSTRTWCGLLALRDAAALKRGGRWRPVCPTAMPDGRHSRRFQTWLEEDYPFLGRLPRLGSLDRALVFRLTPRIVPTTGTDCERRSRSEAGLRNSGSTGA